MLKNKEFISILLLNLLIIILMIIIEMDPISSILGAVLMFVPMALLYISAEPKIAAISLIINGMITYILSFNVYGSLSAVLFVGVLGMLLGLRRLQSGELCWY